MKILPVTLIMADSSIVTHDAVRIRISKKRVYFKRFNIRNFRQIFFKRKIRTFVHFEKYAHVDDLRV